LKVFALGLWIDQLLHDWLGRAGARGLDGRRAGWSASPSARQRDKFVGLLRADREAIMTSFAQLFGETYSDAGSDSGVCAAAMTVVAELLTDVELSVASGEVRIGADLGAWAAAWAGRDGSPSTADGVNAILMFVDVSFASFAAYLAADPDLLPCFRIAAQTANEAVGRFVQVIAEVGLVRNAARTQQAKSDERRRLARELHDRLGEVLSVGLRRLDLQEIDTPGGLHGQGDVARDVLVKAMSRLRTVTLGLREAPLTSIEEALDEYLDSVRAEARVEMEISGDEKRVSPIMLGETFLIVREAVRNALTHGFPQRVQVVVEIGIGELRAQVTDDGCGFEPGRTGSQGVGVASMRERTALMGGEFFITSQPGAGTCVKVRLPLPADAVY
jgi:signal transduction histidine kinase